MIGASGKFMSAMKTDSQCAPEPVASAIRNFGGSVTVCGECQECGGPILKSDETFVHNCQPFQREGGAE